MSRSAPERTSRFVSKPLFDLDLRARRRDRAFRTGPELFLLQRVFDDLVDRLSLVKRSFDCALLIGCPDPGWAGHLRAIVGAVDVVEPGALFAKAAGAAPQNEESAGLPAATFDLAIAVGTLDTVNDLPAALRGVRAALKPDGLLLGSMAGGDTLPRLRSAMRAADAVQGAAAPHVHPRIEPSALTDLLAAAGFVMPVVDVDRVAVGYPSLARLVADLRAMAATSVLTDRPRRPLDKAAWTAAQANFDAAAVGGRTVETFELLNFAGWTPPPPPPPPASA